MVVFSFYLAQVVIFTAVALSWAGLAKLDVGLSAPDAKKAEPWVLLFILWIAIEWAIVSVLPVEVDPAWVEELEQLSLGEEYLLSIILGPISEELLFRGAMFAALMRRWGIWAAAIVPSLLWSLLHTQYEWWFVASIFVSGILLAMIRWTSGSLYLPIGLHAATNLLATLDAHGLLGSTA